jgi:hypothetical protein
MSRSRTEDNTERQPGTEMKNPIGAAYMAESANNFQEIFFA